MAGGNPFSMGPIGTIGAKGQDLSPYFQGQSLRLQMMLANMQQQRQQQLQEQQQREFGLREQAQEFSQRLADIGVKRSDQAEQTRREERTQDINLRAKEKHDSERKRTGILAKATGAEREVAARGQALIAQGMTPDEAAAQLKQDTANMDPETAAAALDSIDRWAASQQKVALGKRQDADKERNEQKVAISNRIRMMLPGIAQQIRQEMPDATPEEMRDRMLTTADDPALSPEERQVVLDEIEQWYKTESSVEGKRMAREDRIALQAERKERQVEMDAAKKQKDEDLALSRASTRFNSDPYVRVNLPRATAIAKDITTKKASLATIEAMAAEGNDAAKRGVAAKRAEIAEMEAEYERIVGELQRRRANYLSGARQDAGLEPEPATETTAPVARRAGNSTSDGNAAADADEQRSQDRYVAFHMVKRGAPADGVPPQRMKSALAELLQDGLITQQEHDTALQRRA